MSHKKRAPTTGVPSYKFCFEGCNFYIIQIPQLLATTCKKAHLMRYFFLVTTSNINFYVITILQLFAIALCAASQPLKRITIKMVLHVSLQLSHIWKTNQ